LSARVDVDRKDEFGDELAAFETMVEKWKKLISEVKVSAASVASASHELSANAEEMSRGATSQVEKTIQVSTASEEMSQASLDIAQNTNSISESAKAVVATAEKGSGIVNRSVNEVKEIAKTVQKSSEFVQDLGSQSEKIGEIINVINEIADQTNLPTLRKTNQWSSTNVIIRGLPLFLGQPERLSDTSHALR
jgi:methyl-accepting chemotaxis protein